MYAPHPPTERRLTTLAVLCIAAGTLAQNPRTSTARNPQRTNTRPTVTARPPSKATHIPPRFSDRATDAGPPGHILYVNAAATGAHNGTNWTDAFNNPQTALSAARVRNADDDPDNDVAEIWVAAGTYMPDRGYKPPDGAHTIGSGNRAATFQLVSGVAVYGGFAGDESTRDQRDVAAHETILSGDLANNDTSVPCTNHLPDCSRFGSLCDGGFCIIPDNNDENSFHVTAGSATDATAIVDGFTIQAGKADGVDAANTHGAGMLNDNGSPTVTHCSFVGNEADGAGGGMRNTNGSSPTITNVTFTHNTADGGGAIASSTLPGIASTPRINACAFRANSAAGASGFGGAIFNSVTDTSPIIQNCSFSRNRADRGGGMANFFGTSPTIINCSFYGNWAEFGGGGIYNASTGDSVTVTNCVFSANATDQFGGAIYNGVSRPVVTNATFHGNTAADLGGGIYNSVTGGSPTLANSILWANSAPSGTDTTAQIYTAKGTPVVNYSVVQGGWTGDGGVGVIDADPLFADPDGPDAIPGTEDDDLRLLPGSPAIDAGDNGAVPPDTADLDRDGNTAEPTPIDLDAHPRILCGQADMGVFEFGIGDYNCNQTTDLNDFGAWDGCMTGPGNPGPPAYAPGCEVFDIRFDAHVDLRDFEAFQAAASFAP